ncbi:MAG: hypothetical protein ACJASN_001386 [Cyclobacteriaceae bacterium]|jgi:hypothetical protein
MKKQLPNFLVIGAGKSGTTSLYEYLNSHLEVFMSPIKETNFFALENEKLVPPSEDKDQMFHYPWSVTDFEAYKALFKDVKNEKAIGEVSPMYLYNENAAHNIKSKIPNVKLIAMLRQPVDRLYSRFMHLARENRTPTAHFIDALDQESIWWKRNDLVQEGFYAAHLQKYFQLFPSEQIKVILYDDFRKDPIAVMQEVYAFVGVDPLAEYECTEEFNVSGLIKSKNIDLLIGQNSLLKRAISSYTPGLSKILASNQVVKSVVNRLRNKNLEKPRLSNELKKRINDEIYTSDILKLEKLIGRDLSHWIY